MDKAKKVFSAGKTAYFISSTSGTVISLADKGYTSVHAHGTGNSGVHVSSRHHDRTHLFLQTETGEELSYTIPAHLETVREGCHADLLFAGKEANWPRGILVAVQTVKPSGMTVIKGLDKVYDPFFTIRIIGFALGIIGFFMNTRTNHHDSGAGLVASIALLVVMGIWQYHVSQRKSVFTKVFASFAAELRGK